MSNTISRRAFNKLLLYGLAGSSLFMSGAPLLASARSARVVVIGGGFGGAAAARHLKKLDPSISVTLVEPKKVFHTCPMSNWVLGGLKTMPDIAHTYNVLRNRYGVMVLHDVATVIDPVKKTVKLKGGRVLAYDRLVVSPGVDFIWDAIEGYSRQAADSSMPYAWEAGPQTILLSRQLLAMRDGDSVLISSPKNPFRCPAAPYERASLIAHYLKKHKPKSKIIILDEKEVFTKQDLFMLGWDRLYPGKIEWRSASVGGKVERVDPAKMMVSTEFGDEKGGVINIIPPQKAGRIAADTGLADASGWCPVNHMTFESLQQPGIYVIGDAALLGTMPKSGTAANTQAKALAASLVASLGGRVGEEHNLGSLCYSLIAPGYAISVAGTYAQRPEGIRDNPDDIHLTSTEATTDQLAGEAEQALHWYNNISQDTWD
ncbi:MAG: FAD-dependent oxidoreductase [Chlorobiaceae bacterium]|jgi:sulfide dehydrogenase [flavocytochrome c] flavoprotein chain|nr:FAD-dependent oxidoreductase [Chlorobiaceae bacterium]